jgi:DNA-binding CsgD family transcriptional regulator
MREAAGALLEQPLGNGVDSSGQPIVIGPTPPLTPVEAQSLERLKERVREPAGAIKATPREREVIGLLALGLTDKEVALKMRISPRTVQAHIRKFCLRNGVRNRAEAAALWTGSHCQLVVSHLKEVITAIRDDDAIN